MTDVETLHGEPGTTAPGEKRASIVALILITCLIGLTVFYSARRQETDREEHTGAKALVAAKSTPGTKAFPTDSPQLMDRSSPPPNFRIFKSRSDIGTAYVVPVGTKDEELKSLLWFFRKSVRSGNFNSIGITKPTAKLWGQPTYMSGSLLVYRGNTCVNEDFVAYDQIGEGAPNTAGANEQLEKVANTCGVGGHESATYEWGLAGIYGEPAFLNDHGDVGGKDVFSYKDDWHAPNEVSPVVDEKIRVEWKRNLKARERFAVKMADEFGRRGIEIDVEPELEHLNWVLTLKGRFKNSARFLNTDFRNELNDFTPSLCGGGFQSVRILQKNQQEVSQSYTLNCQ